MCYQNLHVVVAQVCIDEDDAGDIDSEHGDAAVLGGEVTPIAAPSEAVSPARSAGAIEDPPFDEDVAVLASPVLAACFVAGAAGSSSGVAIAPPPPAPISAHGSEADPRGHSEVSVFTKFGKISFYPSDNRFECRCRHHQVGAKHCVLTRTKKENVGRPAQGRPLGLMMAWLESCELYETKADHGNKLWIQVELTQEVRLRARLELRKLLNGPVLESMERQLRAGEAEEPEDIP